MTFFKKLNLRSIKPKISVPTINYDKSLMHVKICVFQSNIQTILDEYLELDIRIKNVASTLITELKLLLVNDSKNFYPHTLQAQYDLGLNALNLIKKHQLQMELAPGFWNQLKGYINLFIESIFGKKELFYTDKTVFFKKNNINQFQENIHEYQKSMQPCIMIKAC